MRKKRSRKIKSAITKVANVLIIVGLILMAIPAGLWLNAKYYQWSQTKKWQPQIASYSDDYIRTLRHTKVNQDTASKQPQQSSGEKGFIDSPADLVDTEPVQPGESVAYLEIPKLGIKLSVIEGEAWSNLAKGPVRVSKTAMIGDKGSVLISGHRTMYGAPFNQLHEIQLEDKIILSTKKALFIYTVVGIKKVSPDDWSDIKPDGEPQLVLSTCEPMYSADKRLLIITRLSEARKL